MTLPAPPNNEPAWSICTLAGHLGPTQTPLDVYDQVIPLIRTNGVAGAFRLDLDRPPRTFPVPDLDGTSYPLDDAYLTDGAVTRALSRLRDGVVIPGGAS